MHMNSAKVFVKTYGCQSNVYDSERMMELCMSVGYEACTVPEEADVVIFNTCHIREKAEHKLFSDLGRFRHIKRHREKLHERPCFLIVAGCTGQALGKAILERAPYVSAVLGPQTYHILPKMLKKLHEDYEDPTSELALDYRVRTGFPKVSKFTHLVKTRQNMGPIAFLSIQEGCDKFCRFCVVPYTRGAEYSRPVEELVQETQILVAQGAKSIILSGQNVNAYHGLSSTGEVWGLGRLIQRLAEFPEIVCIRYTSPHPRDMTDDLIEVHRTEKKLAPLLHLPVQSGSNKILEAMNRRYTGESYKKCIERLRSVRPDIAFSSDFIVGYPGETDKDFQDTCDLVREVFFVQAYSFQYSPRPGTPAAEYEQVPQDVKHERLMILQDLLNTQQLEFNRSFVGTIMSVLIERVDQEKIWGRTLFMQSTTIIIPDDTTFEGKVGDIVNVRIIRGLGKNLHGVFVPNVT